MTASAAPTPSAAAWKEVDPIWMRRSQVAAKWIDDAPAITDIGCGAMGIRSLLRPGVRYIGSDVVARDADTIVCDLNVERMPQFGTRDATMLGVFEYLDDVPDVLQQLRQFERVVVSYCPHSFWRRVAKRTRYWRNHYTRRQLRRMFEAAGFEIVRYKNLRVGEVIYMLKRI